MAPLSGARPAGRCRPGLSASVAGRRCRPRLASSRRCLPLSPAAGSRYSQRVRKGDGTSSCRRVIREMGCRKQWSRLSVCLCPDRRLPRGEPAIGGGGGARWRALPPRDAVCRTNRPVDRARALLESPAAAARRTRRRGVFVRPLTGARCQGPAVTLNGRLGRARCALRPKPALRAPGDGRPVTDSLTFAAGARTGDGDGREVMLGRGGGTDRQCAVWGTGAGGE